MGWTAVPGRLLIPGTRQQDTSDASHPTLWCPSCHFLAH